MNPPQKRLLGLGAAVMLAMLIFPPWTKITHHIVMATDLNRSVTEMQSQEFVGYSPLFSPPPARGLATPQYLVPGDFYETVEIDIGLLFMQWLVAASLTGTGLLYFKGSDKKSLHEWWTSVINPAKTSFPSNLPQPTPPVLPSSTTPPPLHATPSRAQNFLKQAPPISNKVSEAKAQKQMSPWKRALKPAEAVFSIGVFAGIATAANVQMDVPTSDKLLFDGFMAVLVGLLLAVPTYLVAAIHYAAKQK